MSRRIFALLVAFALSSPNVRAEEPPAHFVFPVKTALQRELASPKVDVVVLVDTTEVLKGGRLELDALKLPELRKAILPYKATDARLQYTFFIPKEDGDLATPRHFVHLALIGLAHDAGFAKVTAIVHYDNTDKTWADRVAVFTGKPRRPPGDEAASSADGVKVYPVRTPLSRHLTSDADCVVVVAPSLAESGGVVPAKVRAAAVDLVAKLKLPNAKKVAFTVQGPRDTADKLRLSDALDKLAKEMKFEASSVTFR